MADELAADDQLAIHPVARLRAHEEVARQLRDLMESGALEAGAKLPPERELARRFGVSRATVRQALSALQSAGLVESQVGRGTVARMDGPTASVTGLVDAFRMAHGTLNDQLELRRLIEPPIAREAATRARPFQVERLRDCLARQEALLDDPATFLHEDSAFHLAVAEATENPLVVKMLEGVNGLLQESHERSLIGAEGPYRSIAGHRRVVAAVVAEDGQAAAEAMAAHILEVERLSLEVLSREST